MYERHEEDLCRTKEDIAGCKRADCHPAGCDYAVGFFLKASFLRSRYEYQDEKNHATGDSCGGGSLANFHGSESISPR
jgi:hypothetical protein